MAPAARRQARDLASGKRNDLVGGGGVGVCLTMDFDGFGAEEEEKSLVVVAARCSDCCTLDRIILYFSKHSTVHQILFLIDSQN